MGWLGVVVCFALIAIAPAVVWKQHHNRASATTRASGDADMLGTGPVDHTHARADSMGHSPATSHLNRSRRSLPTQYSKHKDPNLLTYGGIELNYTLGSTTTYQFDLCNVINCGQGGELWQGYDLYICGFPWGYPTVNPWCGTWGDVIASSSPHWQPTGYWYNDIDLSTKVKFWRRSPVGGRNPVQLSLLGLSRNPWGDETKSVYFIIGVDHSGADTMALVKVNFLPSTSMGGLGSTKSPKITMVTLNDHGTVDTRIRTPLSPTESIAVATGYEDKNMWLGWLMATAASFGMTNCVACSAGKPTLITVPAPLHFDTDPVGFQCMMSLTMGMELANCTTLAKVFPVVKNNTKPPVFTPERGNYTCFIRNSGNNIGHIDPSWCQQTVDLTAWTNATRMVWARGDLFWYCGTCALVRLALPIVLLGAPEHSATNNSLLQITPLTRQRRSTVSDAFDFSSETYIDAIGVPRGVPDRYKLANPIASGFENLPIISALFPITPNKNVDRINYIHYNVQRLSNATRDAVTGLSEQLASTSLMAIQNRMALDMLLAEKGGVCHMFGEQCCTFIANNTAPDGSVTRALSSLKTFSSEMADHSGVSNQLLDGLSGWFGDWKGALVSGLVSLVGVCCVLVLVGCCCVPCVRSLCSRIIITAMGKPEHPPPYQMTALAGESTEFTRAQCYTLAIDVVDDITG
ncbi:Endogenous retrovirus group V member 2 Env polyprotein [Merluccius polli]|uniref:Endogenous retrovirus group V member 2 Env polyprotein n=1 Tax=Merluccius polli TaxID=89951 RepID=A0AA47MYJ1_MERPO|nr:Endogenous retrovirus group V member 2 Env polyprotein [Merluccius polli]